MRYWQITTRRLSRAAAKLTMDEAWHPFTSSSNSWYRVWRKKIVQRATFEADSEESILLPLVETIEPLPDLASVAGFREELNIELTPGGELQTILPLGYPLNDQRVLEKALSAYKLAARQTDNLLYGIIPIKELTREALVRSTEIQVALRLLYQALQIANDSGSQAAAIDGFSRMMEGALSR